MSEQPVGAAGAPGASRRWWVLVVVALAQLMIVLDVTIVTVALPRIQRDLGISTADRQLVLTVYALTFGGLLLLGGRIADVAGRKRVFLIGLVGFAAASAIGGASVDSGMLMAARGVQGAFAALMAPTALSVLTNTFPDPAERGKAFAVFGAVAGGGSAIGLTLSGVLTQYLSWRWIFYVNIPIAVAAIAGAAILITDSTPRHRTRFDLPGAVTVTAGLAALVYGFSEAVSDGWTSPVTLGLIVGGVVLLAAFTALQWRGTHPLLPLRLVANRGRGAAYLTVLLATVGMFGAFFFLPFYLEVVRRDSPLDTGIALLPMTGTVIVSAAIVSQVMHRVPPRLLMGVGLFAAAAGMGWLSRLGPTTGYPAGVLGPLLLAGAGLGMVFPVASNLATFQIAPAESGVASATLNVGQQVGGSLGTAILNAVAAGATAAFLTAHHGSAAAVLGLIHGYDTAFAWGAVVLVVAALVAIVLTRASLGRVGPGTAAPLRPGPAGAHRRGRHAAPRHHAARP